MGWPITYIEVKFIGCFANEKYSWDREYYETMVNIQGLEIHQIVVGPTIMPYNNMTRHKLTHVNFKEGQW